VNALVLRKRIQRFDRQVRSANRAFWLIDGYTILGL
jgi:hypothetical protein